MRGAEIGIGGNIASPDARAFAKQRKTAKEQREIRCSLCSLNPPVAEDFRQKIRTSAADDSPENSKAADVERYPRA